METYLNSGRLLPVLQTVAGGLLPRLLQSLADVRN
jgi:hypothetical protein